MSIVSGNTPGTAAWLRDAADMAAYEDFREGLIRAANRIERLEAELGKQKTGVDQSFHPMAAPVRPAPRHAEIPEGSFRVRLPQGESVSDRDARDNLFKWIDGSENLGIGALDPCVVHLLGKPDEGGGTWDLDTVIGVTTLQKDKHDLGYVRVSWTDRSGPFGVLESSSGSIDLTDCHVTDVQTLADETIVTLAAKTVEKVQDV